MYKKPIFSALLFLSLTASLFAQTSVGLEGGLSCNTLQTSISNRTSTNLSGNTGLAIGLPFRYRIYSWLYAVAVPALIQKGYSLNRTDSLTGEYEKYDNTYFQLSIGVSLMYDRPRLRVELDPGLYAGYWLYGRIKGQTADIFSVTSNNGSAGQPSEQFQLTRYNVPYSFLSQRDNRWEEGWWIGPGIMYRLRGSWWLTATARYFQSFSSREKAPVNAIPAYDRTWTFQLGGIWTKGKRKPHP